MAKKRKTDMPPTPAKASPEPRRRLRPIRVDLSEDDYQLVDRIAKSIGLNKSSLMRMILYEYLKSKGHRG